MTGVSTSGVHCVLDAVSFGCPVAIIAALQVAGVDLNKKALGANLLRFAIKYLRDDVLEFCLNIITDQQSKNKALENSVRQGNLCTVEILVRHGADLNHEVDERSLLDYALRLGCFEKLQYFVDHGIEPSATSISTLLIFCTGHFMGNIHPLSCQGQITIQHHLKIQDIMELLLSRKPQLIDDKWDIIHIIKKSHVCLVVKLIQYGANLEGMEDLALRVLHEKTKIDNIHACNPLQALATLLAIAHASTSLHQLSWVETSSDLMHRALVCLYNRAANPCRLKELCRATIMWMMRGRAWPEVPQLGLPLPLQNYLRYADLITHVNVHQYPDSPHHYTQDSNMCLCFQGEVQMLSGETGAYSWGPDYLLLPRCEYVCWVFRNRRIIWVDCKRSMWHWCRASNHSYKFQYFGEVPIISYIEWKIAIIVLFHNNFSPSG